MGILNEFKQFAIKGNVVDMAVGIIIGAAFSTVVQSFVNDILMPPIGLLLGDDDVGSWFLVLRDGSTPGPYTTVAAADAAGAVVWSYGAFINSLLSFLIVGFTIFFFVKSMNKLRRNEEDPTKPSVPTNKTCKFCASSIPIAANRCPQCTSQLTSA